MPRKDGKENKPEHPCGECQKNVGNNCRAVLCRNECLQWYHMKCTSLTIRELKQIDKSNIKWSCDKCMNKRSENDDHCESSEESKTDLNESDPFINMETRHTNDITMEVNKELEQQLENLHFVVNTLNEDLQKAKQEIEDLRNQNVCLETMVLQKEEKIILLQAEIKELKNNLVTSEESFTVVSKKKHDSKRNSLPAVLTSFSQNSKLNRTINHRSYSSVVNKEQNKVNFLKRQSFTKSKNVGPSYFSENRYNILTPPDDSAVEDTSVLHEVEDRIPEKKMLICADSHGKDLSWHINTQINNDQHNKSLKSVGFVTPGGRASQILSRKNIDEELKNEEDMLVIMCGTNDVARNEGEEALKRIKKTLDECKDKKIILVDLPNRYDLVDWSCVNQETRKTNLELKRLGECYTNVTVVDASKAERQMHTSNGMHLNRTGKRWLAERICEAAGISSCQPEHTSGTRPTPAGNDQPPTGDLQPSTPQPTLTNS
ncbi:hypothetical protein J6590_069211 [Homalodisca vitripennis]|nr:hypothetical protein J6590_069211 [Homalodisca vitripennis]